MKKPEWRDLVEIVGIVAIVASLIFVGLQLKQSQEIAIADQYQERANAANEVMLALMEGSDVARFGETLLAELRSKNLPSEVIGQIEEIPAEDLGRQLFATIALMTLYDNNHFQYEAGFLDQAAWTAFRTRMKAVLRNPINRVIVKTSNVVAFRPSFRAVTDEVIAELDEEDRR